MHAHLIDWNSTERNHRVKQEHTNENANRKAHFSLLGSNPFWTLSKSSFDFIDRVFPIVKMVLEYHMDKHGDCDYYYDDDIDHNEFDNDDNDGDDDDDDDV